MEEVIGSIPLGSTISLVDPSAAPVRTRAGSRFLSLLMVMNVVGIPTHVVTWPDTAHAEPLQSSNATLALVEDLRARILRSDSATAVLEAWCAEKGLAGQARLIALRRSGPETPPSPAQRERLGVGPNERVRHRHVRLACGDRILSEADNWYVPARLTPVMNAALDESDVPFGRVVRPLAPARKLISVQTLPLPQRPGPDAPLVQVDAVLVTADGIPFCEVVETYLGAALPPSDR